MREYIKSAANDLVSQAYNAYEDSPDVGDVSFDFVCLDEWDETEFATIIKAVSKTMRSEFNHRTEASNFCFTVQYQHSKNKPTYHTINISWTQEPIDNPFEDVEFEF